MAQVIVQGEVMLQQEIAVAHQAAFPHQAQLGVHAVHGGGVPRESAAPEWAEAARFSECCPPAPAAPPPEIPAWAAPRKHGAVLAPAAINTVVLAMPYAQRAVGANAAEALFYALGCGAAFYLGSLVLTPRRPRP